MGSTAMSEPPATADWRREPSDARTEAVVTAGGSPVVLVACTNFDTREICTLGLRHAGYDVVPVDDPDGVLDLVRGTRPDLVITSYPTRLACGTLLAAAIRADHACAATLILNVSSWVWPDDFARASHAGVTESLPLPIRLQDLVDAVRRLVGPAPCRPLPDARPPVHLGRTRPSEGRG